MWAVPKLKIKVDKHFLKFNIHNNNITSNISHWENRKEEKQFEYIPHKNSWSSHLSFCVFKVHLLEGQQRGASDLFRSVQLQQVCLDRQEHVPSAKKVHVSFSQKTFNSHNLNSLITRPHFHHGYHLTVHRRTHFWCASTGHNCKCTMVMVCPYTPYVLCTWSNTGETHLTWGMASFAWRPKWCQYSIGKLLLNSQ